MYSINPYKSNILKWFSFLEKENGMIVSNIFNNSIEWENERFGFHIGIEKYYPDVNFIFINKLTKNSLSLFNILKNKMLQDFSYPNEVISAANTIEDKTERQFYYASYLVKNYCQEYLS